MGRMRSKKTSRFVIQRHERQGEAVHWDLMLEKHGALETYRVNKPPEEWGTEPIEAVKIFDHPLKFLTYEGSVNKGRGRVAIADAGTYRLISQNESRLTLDFAGTILKREFIFSIGGRPVRRE
jgi:bifunctional non-homologous end joining protein LigD